MSEALAQWGAFAPNKIFSHYCEVSFTNEEMGGDETILKPLVRILCVIVFTSLQTAFRYFRTEGCLATKYGTLNLSRAVANLESLNHTSEITVSPRPRFPYCSRKCKAGFEPVIHLERRSWCIPRLGVEAQRPADLKWSLKNLTE